MHSSPSPRQQRRLLAVGLLATAALTMTACGSGSPSGAAPAESAGSANAPGSDAEAVRIGYFPLVHTSTVVNADQSGLLEEHGITAELVQTQGGAAVIPALTAGDVDIAYANYTSALLAAQKGLPIVLFAGNDVGAEDHGIYVNPNAGIESIADLKGKRFAVNNLQNIGSVAILAQAQEAGLEPGDINIVEMPYPDMAAAVQNGNVDAIWQVEPFQALAEEAGLVRIGDLFDGAADDMPVAGWVTTRQFAEQHPEVLEGFQSALDSSMSELEGDRNAFTELVPTYTSVSADVVENIELPQFAAELDVDRLQDGADLMLKYDLIQEALDVHDATHSTTEGSK
jgi:ABC-type nitrate/sulfonate/bicarbonate transport system substrate-binding protein